MAFLKQKIAELRQRYADQHGSEMAQLADLGQQIARQNEEVNTCIDDLLQRNLQHRAQIGRKLVTVAQCVGLIPNDTQPEPKQLAEPVDALDAAIDGADVSTSRDLEPMPRMLRNSGPIGAPGSSRFGASDAVVPEARFQRDASQGLGASAPVNAKH